GRALAHQADDLEAREPLDQGGWVLERVAKTDDLLRAQALPRRELLRHALIVVEYGNPHGASFAGSAPRLRPHGREGEVDDLPAPLRDLFGSLEVAVQHGAHRVAVG